MALVEYIKPLAGIGGCQESHTDYGLSGRLHIFMNDGSEFDTGSREAPVIPPGHAATTPWTSGTRRM